MKKVLALVAATGIVAAASFASAASIIGSKHDMSSSGTYASSGSGTSSQICIYCHAPHNAALSLPLWNRNNPAGSLFTLYSGVGMQSVSFKGGFTSDSTSLFCMSCHDGQTGIQAVHNAGIIEGNAVVNNTAALNADAGSGAYHTAAAGTFVTGALPKFDSANLTHDLSRTHPINFPVPTVNNTQNDLNVGSGPLMGPGVAPGFTFTKTFPLYKTSDFNSARSTTNRSLECGSCHAVHDSLNSPFLRDTMTRSQLCLGCHNK